jgi:hypothetical protein
MVSVEIQRQELPAHETGSAARASDRRRQGGNEVTALRMTDGMSTWAKQQADLEAAIERMEARKRAKKIAAGAAILPVAGGKYEAIVDAHLLPALSAYRWNVKLSKGSGAPHPKRTTEAPGSSRAKDCQYERRQVSIMLSHTVLEMSGKPRPPKHVPDHKNGDSLDNRADNLEWVTQGENIRRMWALRKMRR